MKTIDEQDAEITDLRAQLAARDATIKLAKEALEKAVSVIGECPKAQRGAGGMTVDAMLARTVFNGVPFSVYEELSEALAALDAAAVEKPNVERVARSIGAMVREWATGHNPWKGEGLENVIRTRLNRFYGHEPADAPESAGEEG